jgi:hypothetical protein
MNQPMADQIDDRADRPEQNSLDLDALAVSDFDWPGVAIAASVMGCHGARPWRMGAADYAGGVRADSEHVPPSGTPQPTPWDPELGEVMAATGRVIYEETVADSLITDLSARS